MTHWSLIRPFNGWGSSASSTSCQGEVLPHLLRNLHGQSQTTKGAKFDAVLGHVDLHVTEIGESVLDHRT